MKRKGEDRGDNLWPDPQRCCCGPSTYAVCVVWFGGDCV